MFKLAGTIVSNPIDVSKKHKSQSSWKAIAIVQFKDDFCDYYRWFIKREFGLYLNPPLRGSHITVVNDRLSDINGDIMDIDGIEIDVYYDPNNIRCNGEHWWINIESEDVKNVRETLDLPKDPYYGLHLTIGHATGINLDICEYSRIYSLNRDKLKYYDL